MKRNLPLLAAVLAPALILLVWEALGPLVIRQTLDEGQRAAVDAALLPLAETHGALLIMWWGAAACLAAWLGYRAYLAVIRAPQRLTDATQVQIRDPHAPPVQVPGPGFAVLTDAINELAAARRRLDEDAARLIEEASRSVAVERDQLGALMAELHQCVVVCNRGGRILLYNGRARSLFRRLSRAPVGIGGAELMGLGRSIFGVIDKPLIEHAVETVERHIARGELAVSARFVMDTPAGHLLHVSLAPVRSDVEDGAMTGFVLLIEDITDEYAGQSRRDALLLDLTEKTRAALANVQTALDILDYPDIDAADRARFQSVVREEIATMGDRLAALDAATSQDLMTRWPLQEMPGADLIAAAARGIEAATGAPVATCEVASDLWLNVDSFSLIRSLSFLGGRLAEGTAEPGLALRLVLAGSRAHLDLACAAPVANAEMLAGWLATPMQDGAGRSPLSVRDVASRHGGEVWFEKDGSSGTGFFRFLLPLAADVPEAAAPQSARPEYYDFDLFDSSAHLSTLDDRKLSDLTYTVFDTETTGLDPGGGDEILQMGAVRIVNGKLLRSEGFDQLVDPGRSIPEASIPFHGVTPDMVRGQPRITEVLPAFYTFAADTVLVGHNLAFDMRFLKLKEEATGLRFDHPVLDTLLLASLVHPGEDSHSMEAIAARLGVEVSARHSAAGDALTTARIFLKLLPLLDARGIVTLKQAREAAETSYFARLKY